MGAHSFQAVGDPSTQGVEGEVLVVAVVWPFGALRVLWLFAGFGEGGFDSLEAAAHDGVVAFDGEQGLAKQKFHGFDVFGGADGLAVWLVVWMVLGVGGHGCCVRFL